MTKALQAIIAIILPLLLSAVQGKTIEYNLSLERGTVNFSGKDRPAMTVNGGIPGPTLRFTEGDEAVIHVHNKMDVPTSVHWHGLLVPPGQDGVPFISYPPIKAGATFTYRYPIRQSGTYWYHSHTEFQEQRGVYGSIVIQPRVKRIAASKEKVLVLSDWTDMNPHQVQRQLRRGSEFMGVRKKTAQSLLGAVKTGKFGDFWRREAMRMPPMDLADVAYDAFLINGQRTSQMDSAPGETVRLRIINGSASSYFYVHYAGGPLTIVSADGQDVRPVELKEPLLIGVAETYDVLVKTTNKGAFELRATSYDGSGQASLWIGAGEKKPASDIPQPFVYDTMKMFDWKRMFALTPAGTMGMPTRQVRKGMFDHPGMNMSGMKAGGMKMQSMKMSASGHEGMDMSGMEVPANGHEGMDMGDMEMPANGHEGMDMGDSNAGNQIPEMKHGGMSHMDMADSASPGVWRNTPKWYDFLLREDAAHGDVLAKDGMMSKVRPFPPYERLRAPKRTDFKPGLPRREVRLTLDGDMDRYVWMFNGETLDPSNDIWINKGEVVRFIFINRTMMHHPLHLHGHFFRVINGQGDYSPLKHTVDVAPMNTTVIEFEANEFGDWFFHCHLLYHMHAGMARVVRYNGFTSDPQTEAVADKLYHQPWLFIAQADVLSNMTQGTIQYEDLMNILSLSWKAGWHDVSGVEWESELVYDRYLNRFSTVFAGIYSDGNDFDLENERLIAGVRYLLPFNFRSTGWVDSDGGARVTIDRSLMLTPRLGIFGEVEYDTRERWSYQGGASYLINANLAATALWDSDYGWGAGVTIEF